ncbi:hypothetical protein HYPBUDRAFT_153351 [Hyphopichia burtonii NRRL Y-1933]|uniref:Signal recognition particle subunit SRP14 n=1 Tax=Hyphopichia burtonii NRRL Y-1933 TaxID=984485 RepID=A0A1E4RH31_9ASCO|nr:hypothetical protein HYPBUDRAFT_153351 [Hyphopichia burtonii NRRL Y-1933]ODV66577.1 hypothetical protein HYPBUDRAFT_153351 [Hyphopichia burtonii NRRL Y-1933]
MGRLNNAEFLLKVGKLLEDNDGKSSVYLTQKRLSVPLETETTGINDLSSNVIEHEASIPSNTEEYPVLIRLAMNGDKKEKKEKVKLSTVVETTQLDQFWVEYAQVIKTGFTGLKKKEKKKSKKSGKVTK